MRNAGLNVRTAGLRRRPRYLSLVPVIATALILGTLMGCTAAPGMPGAGPAQVPMVTIKISEGVLAAGPVAPLAVAKVKGWFNEERINLEMIQMAGTAAVAAMSSGDLDVSHSSGTTMNSILHGGQFKVIAVSIEKSPYYILTTMDDIRGVRDLEGRKVGIQQTADSYHETTTLALTAAGGDPSKVTFASLGAGQQRIAAVINKSVDAVPLLGSERSVLLRQYPQAREIVDVGKVGVKQHVGGMAISDARIAKDRDSIVRFLAAYVKGVRYTIANMEDATTILGQDPQVAPTQIPHAELLAGMHDWWDNPLPTLQHTKEVQQEVIDTKTKYFVKDANPGIGPSQVFDFSLIDDAIKRVDASGWKP